MTNSGVALPQLLAIAIGVFAFFGVQVDTAYGEPSILGLPPLPYKLTANSDLVGLGKRLFSDTRLSADGTIACVTCHQPQHAFTDGKTTAIGIGGQTGTRNAPSLVNIAYASTLFWDGRRPTLEAQALDPFTNPLEHGLSDAQAIVGTIRADRTYCAAFEKLFTVACNRIRVTHVATAIAAYERTLRFGDARFDRYEYGHEASALTQSEIRGLGIFRGRARCQTCHTIGEKGALFTDFKFHSLGVGLRSMEHNVGEIATKVHAVPLATLARNLILKDPAVAALGRYNVTKRPQDIGKFKTPSLRNVALTAPYMHDGSVATLDEAVNLEIYYRSGESNQPVILTPIEKTNLIAFLRALTSPAFEVGGEKPQRTHEQREQ